jgi:hypothetical protein
MAGISELKSLAARKQALVAQSEVYRQALASEVQALHSYRAGLERKLRVLRALKPLLFIVPLAGSLLGLRLRPKPQEKKPARGWQKVLGTGLAGWRLYRRAAPFMAQFLSRRRQQARSKGFGEFTL